MSHSKRLDKASSVLFFTGFIIGKFRYTPFPLFSLIATITSFFLYLAGYSVWFFASLIYPHHPRMKNTWYGYEDFKKQSKMAALIGIVAMLCCFIGMLTPIFILPSLWLFVASNIIWFISEYHKFKNPPTDDPDYSTTRQQSYLEYAFLMTGLSIFTAAATTLAVLFPPSALIALTTTAVVGLIISLTALNCWFDHNFGEHTPDALLGKSYKTMSKDLGPSNQVSLDNTLDMPEDQAVYTSLDQWNLAPKEVENDVSSDQEKVISNYCTSQ